MSIIHQFSIDGQIVTVPEEELEDFFASMSERGIEPEEVNSFQTDDGEILDIPASEQEEFEQAFGERQIPIRNMRTVQMDDGETLKLGEEDIRQFVQARQTGMPMSRGLLANTGIPDWYGKSRDERESLADKFAAMFPLNDEVNPDYLPRERNLGDAISENVVEPIEETLGHIKTQTEAQYGRDVSNAEAVAANLPFSGSVMDANEARIESVEKRLWNGDYRDTLEASRLALSIGIPEEDVRAANENGGDFASLVRDDLASRIETRQKKGDRLAHEDLNFLQKAAIGAAGMVKTIPEMANPVVGAATIGPAIMNRAAGLNDGEWAVDENGNPVQTMTGDGGDLSMLKGAAGAIGERVVWGSKLPGSGKLAEKLGKGFAGRNAAQIADMVAKGDITDFIDNVVGTNVSEADAKKTVADWAEEHLLPQGFAEDVLEAIPAHFALKGAKLLTKGGREQLKAERQAAKDEKAAADARRAAQEREEAAAKEVARAEARTRYEANLSEEARADIENRVNDMVKTGVLPSYRHAQEVERLAAEKLGGRERGESTEAVEQAVMEAAQEVAERLQTPERVTTPALERRQTEAQMRENERLTKIGEQMGEEIANAKPERAPEDTAANEAVRAEREAEIQRVFDEQYNDWMRRREEAHKKGGKFTEKPPTKEDVANQIESDFTEPAEPVRPDSEASSPTDINRNPAQVDNETPEKPVSQSTKAENSGENLSPREKEDYESRYAREKADFDAKKPERERKLADVNARIEENDREIEALKKSFKGSDEELLKSDRWNELTTKFGELLKEKSDIEHELKEPETPHDRNVRENKADIAYVKDHISYLKQLKKNALKKGESAAVHDKDIAKYEGLLKALKGDTDARVTINAIPIEPPLENAPSRAPSEAKPISEMSRKELTQKAQSLLNEVRKAMEGDDQSALESANKAYHDFIDGVREDGRFTRFESIDNGDIIANRVTFTDKPTDADYKAYLKKNGKRDSKKARNGFERAWNKEHREPFSTNANAPSRAPQEKGTTTPPNAAKPVEAQNGANGETKPDNIPLVNRIITAKTIEEVDKINDELSRVDGSARNADTIRSLRSVARSKGSTQYKVTPSFGKKFTDADVSYIKKIASDNGLIATMTYDGELLIQKPFHREGDARNSIAASDVELAEFLKKVKSSIAHSSAPLVRVPDVKGKMVENPEQREVKSPFDFYEKAGAVDANGVDDGRPYIGKVYYNKENGFAYKIPPRGYTIVYKPTSRSVLGRKTFGWTVNKLDKKGMLSEVKYVDFTTKEEATAKFYELIGKTDTKVPDVKGRMVESSPLSRANAARAANADAANARLAKMETADLQDQRAALLSAQEQGDKSKATTSKIEAMEAELNRRGEPLEHKTDQSVEMRNIDPKRRSRQEVVEWAKKSGRQVIDGKVTPDGMREYDAQMAQKAKKVVKRLFPDMTIEYYEKAPEKGGKAIDLRNHHGDTLGRFDPGSKKVVLLPGADAETVAHEIGWHGVRDWASRNSPKLFAKMREVEDNVDPAIRSKVLRIYRKATGYSHDDLLNEFGAWSFMGRGGKALEEVVSTRDGAAWYAKMLNAAKDIYKDYAANHGGNRADLSEIETMTGEQLMDFMAREIASGKTLGEIGAQKPSGSGNAISTKETRIEKMKRKVYDIGSVFRAIEKDIEKKTGHKVSSDDSVDQAFGLKSGLNEATNINIKAKIADIKDSYAKYDISHEDFAHYMACKAAVGRDAKVDAKNIAELKAKMHDQIKADWGRERINADPAGFKAACDSMDAIIERNYRSSNGSNIPPAEAAKTVREWETGDKKDAAELIRYKWRELIEETIDRQVEAGLISKEQAELWKKQEPEYVPFKSPIDELTGEYVGRSDRNFSRAEHYQAKGRQTAAGDVLTHALMDWQATQNRAVDNELRQKLAKMVEAHPELGTVEKLGNSNVREKKTKDKFTKDGRILLDDGGDPNVVIFKRNGESYAIRLNGTRGIAAAAAITGRNLSHVNAKFKSFTRGTASLATEHSLTFSVRNLQKDQVAIAEIVMAERGAIDGAKWLGHYASAQKDVHAALWKYVTTGKIDPHSKGGAILKAHIDNGGMIGGYEKEAFGEVAKELSLNEIKKELGRGSNIGAAVANHTLKSVSYLNKMSELMSRVSAFEAERRMGKDKDGRAVTDKSAALFSRRLLTDFNRAGENTGITNVLKMFSNASVGGQARALAAVRDNHKGGAEVLTAMATFGAAQAIINHAINASDDEKRKEQGLGTGKDVGEYEIRSSFANIRVGDKMYKLGQHEDVFTFASYVGNVVARYAMGELTKEEAAKNIGVTVAELASVFTGLGEANLESKDGDAAGISKAIGLYLVPSVAQPAGEIIANQDFAGRKAYTDTYPGNKNPRSELGRSGTPEYAKTTARWLNKVSGGNEHRPGKVDVQPEVIQKLVEGYGKNALKDITLIYGVGKAIMNGEYGKLEDNLKPFKRDFVRTVPDSTDRYFSSVKDFKTDVNEFKGSEGWAAEEQKSYLKSHPWVRYEKQMNKIASDIEDLRKIEQGFVWRKVNGSGRWVKPEVAVTDEKKEKAKKQRLELQAQFLKIMGW